MEHLEKIQAVTRMQQYIEEHLTDPITLLMLARAANYSPWHASRIFKELLGRTPFEYIRALRLSQAAIVLQEEDVRVVDVALDFVFDSHEGFTRAFSKQFGITPKAHSKQAKPLKLFMPKSAHEYYLNLRRGVSEMVQTVANESTVFVQVIDRPARKLILKRGVKATHYFEYCKEVGCEVWDELSSIRDALYEPIGMWLPTSLRPEGTSEYAQGVEMPHDYIGTVPEGYDMIDLPACKMMVFQGAPYDDEKFGEAIGELWEVMKRYNPELYGFTWAEEDGPRFQLVPMGYRGYIEARPVKAL